MHSLFSRSRIAQIDTIRERPVIVTGTRKQNCEKRNCKQQEKGILFHEASIKRTNINIKIMIDDRNKVSCSLNESTTNYSSKKEILARGEDNTI